MLPQFAHHANVCVNLYFDILAITAEAATAHIRRTPSAHATHTMGERGMLSLRLPSSPKRRIKARAGQRVSKQPTPCLMSSCVVGLEPNRIFPRLVPIVFDGTRDVSPE